MNTADLLIEIGTEELPTQAVESIGQNFAENLKALFEKNQIAYQAPEIFSTPRRFAVLFQQVALETPAQTLEHRGPPASANPKAVQGFAEKFNASVDQLKTVTTEKGEYYTFLQTLTPQATKNLLLAIIEQALLALPIKKPMSWGAHSFKFIRPVHWALVLLNDEVLEGKIFGQTIACHTYGHRFLNPAAIAVDCAKNYTTLLEQPGFVIADFNARKNEIRKQIETIGAQKNLTPVIDEDLLSEVTSIVEWPVALLGEFAPEFLQLPPEVISLTLKQNQKCFVLKNNSGELQPYFITICNIESKDPKQVITGNEKVVRARLTDAAFFFAQDKMKTLEQNANTLANVIFQQGLGSVLDKSNRISSLAQQISKEMNLDPALMTHAGLLCKSDLVSSMVSEFPELQGIMGGYYAAHDKQDKIVVSAIREHYKPQGASDQIPESLSGCVLSIADKLDSITGIFALGKKPTGDKDPFALKRAMIGVLRIIIEKELSLDLKNLLEFAVKQQPISANTDLVLPETLTFAWDRMDAWLRETAIPAELLSCVTAIGCSKPYDMFLRIKALHAFSRQPEAASLASAHKRANNLLAKQDASKIPALNEKLLSATEEKLLVEAIKQQSDQVVVLCKAQKYADALLALAKLKQPLDAFFESVMVMCEDESLKQNRLALLKQLSDLFLLVADLSYLPVSHETTHHS